MELTKTFKLKELIRLLQSQEEEEDLISLHIIIINILMNQHRTTNLTNSSRKITNENWKRRIISYLSVIILLFIY